MREMEFLVRRILLSLSCAGLAIFGNCAETSGSAVRKKYVAFGWEFAGASVSNILRVADQLDATSLDGIGIYLRLPRDGRWTPVSVPHGRALAWSDVEPVLPAFRELGTHRSMKESFIQSFCAPTNRLDWANDADWARIGVNMRMLARLAKRSGLKGLFVDDEDYHKQHQFSRRPGELPPKELAALVRRRARETFGLAFEEYPEMTVFFFRFFSASPAYAGSADPLAASVTRGDLWPSFLDGILDVLPPAAKLVDGYEESYEFDSLRNDYLKGYVAARSRLLNLADGAGNRRKYRTQVSCSQAIYLDMYCNREGVRYYSAPFAGSRFGHLAANLGQITHAADEYVWLYGESRQWADWKKARRWMKKYGLWEDAFSGLNETLAALKDPNGYAVRRLATLKASGAFRPENANWACVRPTSVSEKNPVSPYVLWPEKPKGGRNLAYYDPTVGEDDSSSICVEDVPSGCVILHVNKVEPGTVYLVGASAKGDAVSVTLYWKRNGKWDFLTLPGCAIDMSDPDGNGWRHALTTVVVPAEADGFGLQMGVVQNLGEKSWFDNIFVQRVTGASPNLGLSDLPNDKK